MRNEVTKTRKMTGASHIEVTFWFRDESAWAVFAGVPFARKSMTVSDREWDAEPIEDSADGYITRFRFVHTCRNTGAHKSDTKRFINSAARASGIREADIDFDEIELLSRNEAVAQVNFKDAPARLGGGFLTDPRYNAEMQQGAAS